MLEFFDTMTFGDLVALFGINLIGIGLYRIVIGAIRQIRDEKYETCSMCDFKVKVNIKRIQDEIVLNHYEKFHPEVASVARARYGKKED